ncbi:MAG: glycosyltransferase family 39 protein, partial [Gaiellaceae bacterium]
LQAVAPAIPPWSWLAAIVSFSASIRYVLGTYTPAPWIFDDELLYSELASSFGSTAAFAVRDVPGLLGVGPVYPLLIAPAYALSDDPERAYAAAKAINSVLMSLAAVPAYLLARRLLRPGTSLAVAGLSVAIPSMSYTGTLMTENAFYPIFLFAVLAIVRTLEEPSVTRQILVFWLIALAFLTRPQAGALVPAFLAAITITAWLDARASGPEGRGRAFLQRLGAYRLTWLLVAGGGALLLAVQLARGRELSSVLGAYQGTVGETYSPGGVARFFVYHLAELDLYLGVLPFAALVLFVAVTLVRGSLVPAERAFAATALVLVPIWILPVAAVASRLAGGSFGRIEERNVFYLAPLFLVASLLWVERGLPRPRLAAIAAAAAAAVLPLALPLENFVNQSALSDTFALIPFLTLLENGTLAASDFSTLVGLGALGVALLFLLLPRRLAWAVPVLLLAYFVAVQKPLTEQIQGFSETVLSAGLRADPGWIDAAVPPGATVDVLWTGGASFPAIWENEIFNRSVGPVWALEGAPELPWNIPERPTATAPGSEVIVGGNGATFRPEYVLTDTSISLRGVRPVARDAERGMVLYEVVGPLTLNRRLTGLYPDGWSGPLVRYERASCPGGRLRLRLRSDPVLFSVPQSVVATIDGREVSRITLQPGSDYQPFSVPLPKGPCAVTLTVSPTASPAAVFGSSDARELGVRFFLSPTLE